MKKEAALLGIAVILILGLVFADVLLFAGSKNVDYHSSTPKEINYQIDPGQTLTVKGNVELDGEVYFFDFVKLEVLSDYDVQAWVKDYSDAGKGTEGEWKQDGSPVKNNESYFADIYVYGNYIASNSEQEGNGIFFHNYYATDKGITQYEKVEADFLARLKESPIGQLTAVLNVDKRTGDKPLLVKFDISTSTASVGKELEMYKLNFGDGTPALEGTWPTDDAGLNALKSIEHTYSKNAVAILTVLEKGTAKTATATVEIGGQVPDECKQCNSILKCLACIDKQFVSGVFK